MLTPGETSLLWSLGQHDVARIIDDPDYYIASCRDGHRGGGEYAEQRASYVPNGGVLEVVSRTVVTYTTAWTTEGGAR